MRSLRLSRLIREFALVGFAAAVAGCSSSTTQEPLYTAGIPPRPNDGMVREAPPPAYMETGSLGNSAPAPADPYRNYQWRPSPDRPAIAPPPHAPSHDQAMRPDPARQPVASPGYGRPIGGESPPIRVREGDTLYSLASRHGVSVADLIAENRLNGVKIDVGQELRLPPPRH